LRDFCESGKIGEKWGKGAKTAVPLAPTVAEALYGFELFGNGTRRHVPPQKTNVVIVKAVQRELKNLTLNYLEWQINEVAIRVIKPDASVGKGGRSFIQASKASQKPFIFFFDDSFLIEFFRILAHMFFYGLMAI